MIRGTRLGGGFRQRARLEPQLVADLLESAHVVARLLEMMFERLTQLVMRGRRRHLRQRDYELILWS
jgi:hypothetical protein